MTETAHTRKLIANNILIPQIAQLLQEGMEVTLRAKGRSMHPYIRNEKDSLVLKKADVSCLEKGDIVLAHVAKEMYVVHRIISLSGEQVVLMGDGNLFGTERCKRQDVWGKVMYIERKGKRIDCNTSPQRLKALLLRTCFRFPRRVKALIKKILLKTFLNKRKPC